MSSIGTTLTIANGQSQSVVFYKQHFGKGMLLHIPASVAGVIAVHGVFKNANGDETEAVLVDQNDAAAVIDPSSLPVVPCWRLLPLASYGAHGIRIKTYTDSTLASAQTQSADKGFTLMGVG